MDNSDYSISNPAETEKSDDEDSSANMDCKELGSDNQVPGELSEQCLPKILDGTYYKVFSAVSSNDGIRATCVTCNREIGGSIRSTGNFHSHINKKHPELSERCRAYCHSNKRKYAETNTTRTKFLAEMGNKEIKFDQTMKRSNILDGKYFVLVRKWSNGKFVATCRLCHMNVSAHITHTSNLLKHIQIQHHEYIEECLVHCNRGKAYNSTASNKTERDLGKPIEEVYIEDGSTTETNGALSDDLFTDEFDDFSGQYDNAESEGKHSSLMHSSTSKTANRNETQQKNIPENERQQFSQFVYASLNQLSDRNALNAMFDIQGVLTKYRLASLSDNTDKCTLK